MSIKMNNYFVQGMKYMQHTRINKKEIPKRVDTITASWNETGKYLYKAIDRYEKETKNGKR